MSLLQGPDRQKVRRLAAGGYHSDLPENDTLTPDSTPGTVTFTYGGERFDPAAGENDLAYTVLKRSISELSYNYTEGAELSNTICAVIRS